MLSAPLATHVLLYQRSALCLSCNLLISSIRTSGLQCQRSWHCCRGCYHIRWHSSWHCQQLIVSVPPVRYARNSVTMELRLCFTISPWLQSWSYAPHTVHCLCYQLCPPGMRSCWLHILCNQLSYAPADNKDTSFFATYWLILVSPIIQQ